MKHHWLLLGVCAWVVFILMVVGRFTSFRAADFGERLFGQSWPMSKEVKTGPGSTSNNNSQLLSVAPTASDLVFEMERRKQLLTSVCANGTLKNLTHVSVSKFVLDRIFVCDKHKILFCQTPKVGNTQWKKVLMVLNGVFSSVEEIPEELVHDQEKNGLPRLSSLTPHEITHRLNSYFKFLVVRDPFDRLISAFKDKFIKNTRSEPQYNRIIGPAIVHKYHKGHRDSDLTTRRLHFKDFVRYLGDVEGRRHMDIEFGLSIIHWTTYAELCAPCDISYDVIGHHDTLERDAPYILRAAGVERLVAYPHIPPGITRYNQTKVERYFSGISTADIQRLYARFQGDFHLFGYPAPDFLLKSNETSSDHFR